MTSFYDVRAGLRPAADRHGGARARRQCRRSKSHLTLLVLAVQGRAGLARPLPHKNELANACYFTYRVGYIICDNSIPPEEAEQLVKAGGCNQDFRIIAADFQRRILRHYQLGGRPPLEEATWLLNSPSRWQKRTGKECPPMQIISLLLLAEARLPFEGTSATGQPLQLAAYGLDIARNVPEDVYSSLAHAWPMHRAMLRFEETTLRLKAKVAERTPNQQGVAKVLWNPQLVMCRRCGEALNLRWLLKFVEGGPLVPANLILYEVCSKEVEVAEDEDDSSGLRALSGRLAGAAARLRIPLDVDSADGECHPAVVLQHLMSEAANDPLPAVTMFLSVQEPKLGVEKKILELTLRSIAMRTLDVDYTSLSLKRASPTATACQRELWRSLPDGPDPPLAYSGARFLVSAARLAESAKPDGSGKSRLQHWLELMQNLPESCEGRPKEVADAFSRTWHMVFGEDRMQPLRADDDRLPLYLRVVDGASGFSGSRMPQYSFYVREAAGGK